MVTKGISTFLKNSKPHLLLDIRPYADYKKGHIPDAINLPFPIQLRALRKEYGKHIDEKQCNPIIENAAHCKEEVINYLDQGLLLYVYCQAGGLRSLYFQELLKNYSDSLVFLEGGYNAFCEYQTNYFKALYLPHLYVIRGKTGSGKTAIIAELEKRGKQVIPLASLAKHKGSAFGNLKLQKQPSPAQFQHDLLVHCLSLDHKKPIFIEQEGPFIGSVNIPDTLVAKFNKAMVIQLNVSRPGRLAHLMEEYSDCRISEAMTALRKIKNRLEPAHFRKAECAIINNRKSEFASLILKYYDQSSRYRDQNSGLIKILDYTEVDPPGMSENICQSLP